MGHAATRATLLVLQVFVAFTAIFGALFVVPTLPLDWIKAGPLTDFTIPAIALGVACGGSAVVAVVLLVIAPRLGGAASIVAGLFMIAFEVVEIAGRRVRARRTRRRPPAVVVADRLSRHRGRRDGARLSPVAARGGATPGGAGRPTDGRGTDRIARPHRASRGDSGLGGSRRGRGRLPAGQPGHGGVHHRPGRYGRCPRRRRLPVQRQVDRRRRDRLGRGHIVPRGSGAPALPAVPPSRVVAGTARCCRDPCLLHVPVLRIRHGIGLRADVPGLCRDRCDERDRAGDPAVQESTSSTCATASVPPSRGGR